MERLFLFFLKAKPYSIVDINGIIKKLPICLGLSSGALWLVYCDRCCREAQAWFIGCESIFPGLRSTVILLFIPLRVPKLFQFSKSSPVVYSEWLPFLLTLDSTSYLLCFIKAVLFLDYLLLLEHKATGFPQHSWVSLYHCPYLPRPCPPISSSYSSQPVFCFLSLRIPSPSLFPAAKFLMVECSKLLSCFSRVEHTLNHLPNGPTRPTGVMRAVNS